eukprot:527063-Pleurochrysis_carterae.AAC.1
MADVTWSAGRDPLPKSVRAPLWLRQALAALKVLAADMQASESKVRGRHAHALFVDSPHLPRFVVRTLARAPHTPPDAVRLSFCFHARAFLPITLQCRSVAPPY